MGKEDNLVSLADRTTEEQRKIAKLGGIASGKVRKEKREFIDKLKIGLEYLTDQKSKQAQTPELKEMIEKMGFDIYTVLKEIERGNLNAVDRFWDRLYGKPVTSSEVKIEMEVSPEAKEKADKAINDFLNDSANITKR